MFWVILRFKKSGGSKNVINNTVAVEALMSVHGQFPMKETCVQKTGIFLFVKNAAAATYTDYRYYASWQ